MKQEDIQDMTSISGVIILKLIHRILKDLSSWLKIKEVERFQTMGGRYNTFFKIILISILKMDLSILILKIKLN